MTDLNGERFVSSNFGTLFTCIEHHHASIEVLQKRIQSPGKKPLRHSYALD